MKKNSIKPRNTPIKSIVKKAIKTRSKKILKKTAKLPPYMTNKAALKHYRFALKYIELELNGTQAYLAIYGEAHKLETGRTMSNKTAGANACKLLADTSVMAHVKGLTAELLLEDKNNAKTIIGRYARWADSDITDYIDIKIITKQDDNGNDYTVAVPNMTSLRDLPIEMRRNIKSLTFKDGSVKFELVDKKGSNDQLAKLAGLDKGNEETRDIHLHFDAIDEQL